MTSDVRTPPRRRRRPTHRRRGFALAALVATVVATMTSPVAAGDLAEAATAAKAEPVSIDSSNYDSVNEAVDAFLHPHDPTAPVEAVPADIAEFATDGDPAVVEDANQDRECRVEREQVRRSAPGRAQVERVPQAPTVVCQPPPPPPPPPPPTPCDTAFPVGDRTTPTSITNDVMAFEPADGSFVTDDLSSLPAQGSAAADQNGAYTGFARLSQATTGLGLTGIVDVSFHLELPDDLDEWDDLDVRVRSVDENGNTADYDPPSLFSSVFCYADQTGLNASSVYVDALGIFLIDGVAAPEYLTFSAAVHDVGGALLAADTTTIFIGAPPVASGAMVTDAIGLAVTQDALNGIEGSLRDEIRAWAEDALTTGINGGDITVLSASVPLSLDLTWVAAIGANGGLRARLDITNPEVRLQRNNCVGDVTFDDLDIEVDLAVGQTGGALTVSVDDAELEYDDFDIDLVSGGCSFFAWAWALEGLIENRVNLMLDLATFLVANSGVQSTLTTAIQGVINTLSFGATLGGLVNLASTVSLTSVVVQNGGLEIQADASFAADGPFAGPTLSGSVGSPTPPNMNFMTSLRTVPTTGEQFGVGSWLSPALLNQLVTGAVEEGLFTLVDTVGATDAGTLILTGQCGMVATTPVFVDVAATLAPRLSDNPNVGGDPSMEITTDHLLALPGLDLTFRVADTSCGDGGVVGALTVNLYELGLELTANSANQSVSFATQMHPDCPNSCPLSVVTTADPLAALPFNPLFSSLTAGSVLEEGLASLTTEFGGSLALPGQAFGIDIIPMSQDELPVVLDTYFKVLPSPTLPTVQGFETSGAWGPFVSGETVDLTYSFQASSNMPGPKTYTWSYNPGGGTDVTSSGSVSHVFDDVVVPNNLPSTNGPGVSVQIVDQWGRTIGGWWQDEDIFGDNMV